MALIFLSPPCQILISFRQLLGGAVAGSAFHLGRRTSATIKVAAARKLTMDVAAFARTRDLGMIRPHSGEMRLRRISDRPEYIMQDTHLLRNSL